MSDARRRRLCESCELPVSCDSPSTHQFYAIPCTEGDIRLRGGDRSILIVRHVDHHEERSDRKRNITTRVGDFCEFEDVKWILGCQKQGV